MGYEIPEYKVIQENTNKLRDSFTQHARLYHFPGREVILEKIAQIETVYREKARMQTQEADGLRLDQIAFIVAVSNDLKASLQSKDEDECLEAERALFGCVIYRYLRLKECYQPQLKFDFKGCATFFASFAYKDVSECKLYNTLLELFRLEKIYSYTNIIGRTALQNYLNLDECKGRFAYINQDVDFFEMLSDIIKNAKIDAVPLMKQLGFISYIESMGMALSTTDCEITDFINQLSELINKRIETLPEEEYLTRQDIFECLGSLNPGTVVNAIFEDFVPKELAITKDGKMQTRDSKSKWKTDGEFQKVLSTYLTVHSKNILLGTYLLCLNQCNEDTPHLRTAFCTAMGITTSNILNREIEGDKKIIVNALEHLIKFMGRGVIQKIKFDAWGGLEEMREALTDFRGFYEKEAAARCYV